MIRSFTKYKLIDLPKATRYCSGIVSVEIKTSRSRSCHGRIDPGRIESFPVIFLMHLIDSSCIPLNLFPSSCSLNPAHHGPLHMAQSSHAITAASDDRSVILSDAGASAYKFQSGRLLQCTYFTVGHIIMLRSVFYEIRPVL